MDVLKLHMDSCWTLCFGTYIKVQTLPSSLLSDSCC
jgi:hypothetical protein